MITSSIKRSRERPRLVLTLIQYCAQMGDYLRGARVNQGPFTTHPPAFSVPPPLVNTTHNYDAPGSHPTTLK